jgi:hypothetical protein
MVPPLQGRRDVLCWKSIKLFVDEDRRTRKKCLVERLAIVIIYYLANCYLPHFMQTFFLGLGKVFVPYVLKKYSCFI